MKDSITCYSIGALLYCPANREGLVAALEQERFGRFFSIALCLEDTIRDNMVRQAEQSLVASLRMLYQRAQTAKFYMPKIFIRPRRPDQLRILVNELGEASKLVDGFVLPKFSLTSADSWLQALAELNHSSSQLFSIMPILESSELIHLGTRHDMLYHLKDKLDRAGEAVLNIRVGGNDLCHAFGLRRGSNQTIYDVRIISDILSDILTVFSTDYVVSAPVWEYYRGDGWATGLSRELSLDRLNGFVGKTVIHPNQIPLVNQAYRVSKADYTDAAAVLDWDDRIGGLVSGCTAGERMNECNTHFNWAKKTQLLAQVYGLAEE